MVRLVRNASPEEAEEEDSLGESSVMTPEAMDNAAGPTECPTGPPVTVPEPI